MLNYETHWSVKLARTLWFNTYRAQVQDGDGNYAATLRLIPAIPLDRAALPADAPEVEPYVLVLVEDAAFAEVELIHFEGKVADLLLERMAQPDFNPAFCQFAYPSTPHQGAPAATEFDG